MGGNAPAIKRAPGTRVDVVLAASSLKPDDSVKDVAVDVPEQANLEQWPGKNEAMLTPHIGLTGVTRAQSVTVGDGHTFSRREVAARS